MAGVSLNALLVGIIMFTCFYFIILSMAHLDVNAIIIQQSQKPAAAIDPPRPHTVQEQQLKSNYPSLSEQELYMHGELIRYVIRHPSHLGLIKGHVWRETANYGLLKDAIDHARKRNPNERPLVLDVGSNHGLVAIFAATLGADVIAVEPQKELADLIAHSAQALNGREVAERITVYNYAVLSTREFVSMEGQEEGEGAAANVVRAQAEEGAAASVDNLKTKGMIETRPITDFVPSEETRDIAFLKIDVEGFELHAIPSAHPLFASKRVSNVLVEYGPPKRWQVAHNTVADGIQALADAQETYEFDVRLIDSEVWEPYEAKLDDGAKAAAAKNKWISLDTAKARESLLQTMDECPDDLPLPCEGYIWLTSEKSQPFQTFASECCANKELVTNALGKKKMRRRKSGVISLGCDSETTGNADTGSATAGGNIIQHPKKKQHVNILKKKLP